MGLSRVRVRTGPRLERAAAKAKKLRETIGGFFYDQGKANMFRQRKAQERRYFNLSDCVDWPGDGGGLVGDTSSYDDWDWGS